jgi:hypothetical protein
MQNYVTKLLRKTKKNCNYVTFCHPEIGGKNRGFYCRKYPLYGCFSSFVQLKIMRNYVTFRFVFVTGSYTLHVIPRNKQFFTRI